MIGEVGGEEEAVEDLLLTLRMKYVFGDAPSSARDLVTQLLDELPASGCNEIIIHRHNVVNWLVVIFEKLSFKLGNSRALSERD